MDRLDIVVLGATGFAGKHVAKKLALLGKQEEYRDIRWGAAGRSREKMLNLLSELQKLDVNVSEIPILQFDIIKHEKTLAELTGRAKIIINTTGPYTTLSAPIVKACIESGTHYVDISAELYHMINVYRDFHKEAVEASLLIIPACGFANIPTAAGLLHLEKHFKGTLYSVECYTELGVPLRANLAFPGYNNSLIHYGTYHSLVYELKNFKKYMELKKQTFPLTETVPEELQKSFFHRHKGKLWYPYPGPDHDLVEQAQSYRRAEGKMPYHFKMYTTMPLFIHFIVLVPIFFLYYILCRLGCFRKLILTFPRVFTAGLVSHKGPTDTMRKDTKYSFTLNGKGWSSGADLKSVPDKSLIVKLSGQDPGYETTAMSVICAALTVLRDRPDMPIGGVLTPGTAFSNTKLVDRLLATNNVIFELLEKDNNNI